MTEDEYIYTTDLQKTYTLKKILNDITPEINDCIPKDEYKEVFKIIHKWNNDIFLKLNVI